VGIYKNRYGFIPKKQNTQQLSVTELEYNKAKQYDKPMILLVSSDDIKRDTKLSQFILKIENFSTGHFRKVFENLDQLKLNC